MKKKFTLLITVTALLIGSSSGKVWGQGNVSNWPTYWDSGCGCNGGTDAINTSLEAGLNLDGDRYTYWFSGVYTTNVTPPAATYTDTNITNPNSGIYWDGTKYVNYWYETQYSHYDCPANNCGSNNSDCCVRNWYTHTLYTAAIYYPLIACGYNSGNYVDQNHQHTDPIHSHGPLTMNISGGSIYTPHHYAHFSYQDPYWEHRRYTFSAPNGSAGSWSGPAVSTSGYVAQGHFVIQSGASVRLHDATAITYGGGSGLPTTHDLSLPASYYMRFDQLFTGLNSVTYAAGASQLNVVNDANKGLGFFNGVTAANAVTVNKGYLFLGESTTNQNFTVNANGSVFIENYYRTSDNADNGVNVHDLSINFTPFALNSNKLYVSNSNSCKEIIFHTNFAPTGIAGAGGIYIGVHGAGAGGTRGGGITRFKNPVNFASVSTDINIYGGDVIFETAATYTYGGTAGLHKMYAHDDCANGDILFQGGAVAVTKSGGNTDWEAVHDIKTSTGSTVTYNISSTSNTKWDAGNDIDMGDVVTNTQGGSGYVLWDAVHDILTRKDVTFNQSTSGNTTWDAGHDILTYDDIDFDNAGTGKVLWNAGNDISTTGGTNTNPIDFNITGNAATEWHAGRDITTTGQNVKFAMNANVAKLTNWYAGRNITSTACANTIDFSHLGAGSIDWHAASGNIEISPIVKYTISGTGNVTWTAGDDIITHNKSTFDFAPAASGNFTMTAGRDITDDASCATLTCADKTNVVNKTGGTITKQATGGSITSRLHNLYDLKGGVHTNWYAGLDITTYLTNKFTMTNAGNLVWHAGRNGVLAGDLFLSLDASCNACPADSSTRFRSLNSGNITWKASKDIKSDVGVWFDVKNTAPLGTITLWDAGRHITLTNKNRFLLDGTGTTTWNAGQDISILNASCYPCTTDSFTVFKTVNDAGDISLTAGRDIKTNTKLYFDITTTPPPGYKTNTKLDAGHDISLGNDVFYQLTPGAGTTQWLAGNDILSPIACAGVPCAVATIDMIGTNVDDILWQAQKNIKIDRRTNFVLDQNPGMDIQWLAVTNNIETTNDNYFLLDHVGTTHWKAGTDILVSAGCAGCGDDTTMFRNDQTGHIWWEAGRDITVDEAVIDFEKVNNTTYTKWQAGRDINTNHFVTFRNEDSDYTKWQAGRDINSSDASNCYIPNEITFFNDPTAKYIEWWAGDNIRVKGKRNGSSDSLRVYFTNESALFPAADNYMKWHANTKNIEVWDTHLDWFTIDKGESYWYAGQNIDVDRSKIYVADSGQANGYGYTEWLALQDILMDDSKVDFYHDGWGKHGGATDPTGNIKWYGGRDIIATRTPIDFLNFETPGGNGENGYIWWHADVRDLVTQHYSPTNITVENTLLGSAADTDLNDSIRFEAGRDIRTGEGSKWNILHRSNSDMTWIAHNRNIWLQSEMHIVNDGLLNHTLNWAGVNILVDSLYTYRATDDIQDIVWHAHAGNIETNTNSSDYPDEKIRSNTHCGAPSRAMVNITLDKEGYTEWWAGNNIITNDSVKFHYENTSNSQHGMLFHAEEGNIDLRRIFNIEDDSNDSIRFEALTNFSPRNNRHMVNSGLTCFNGTQNILIGTEGNIRSTDSLLINRINRDQLQGSKTEVDAYNDIMTAMVNFTSDYEDATVTDGDNTDIISRMGDIWLGYSYDDPNGCNASSGLDKRQSPVGFDLNRFVYRVPQQKGALNIKAGYDDNVDNNNKYDGGNIYFTHIVDSLGKGGIYNTEISIPFSNMFICSDSLTGCDYERAGIIGGVARCQSGVAGVQQCRDTGFIHVGNNGHLLVDAGTRGNIIFNNGAFLNFQDGTGDSKFLTRWGDIDMRSPFDVDSMQGSLLFLANSELPNKHNVGLCGCNEKKNNVYLQDFRYYGHGASGSIFVGADNNIKLQYGGLKTIGTARDPYYNDHGYDGLSCGNKFHCDADTTENQARALILNFDVDTFGAPITSGGFAAVASDLIDVYKNTIYNGGQGSGLSSVPGYGTLHGESVAGYGLYIKTQANKDNWNKTDHDVNKDPDPTVGAACDDEQCLGSSYLHQVSRVTFHSDARIYTENQRSYISSPVLEVYGFFDLNTHDKKGGKTAIQIQADSLIMHDSLIIDGKLTTFSTWSGLYRDMPIFKLGHQRTTPPAAEDGGYCAPCYTHDKDIWKKGATTPLDTIFVTFRNGASVNRLHTLVADHAVISFLTDSFDHVQGDPTINATFYADTFKVRNHVELFRTADHTHDGHFELVSEPQMHSKEYAGIFSRHLHMEPIAPTCTKFGYSQLWQLKPSLTVITTSTFGGFGWLHSDVHVEIGANLFPGYASLQKDGNCYEQMAGILKMEDLRLDKGANLKFSVGDKLSDFVQKHSCSTGKEYLIGGYADCLDVDSLSIYGEMLLEFVVRPEGLDLGTGESRCFPIIRYKSVGKENLNNLKLKKSTFTEKDHWSINGTYYLALDFDTVCNIVNVCVSTNPNPTLHRKVVIPSESGVTTNPGAGIYFVQSGNDFRFKVMYSTPEPLMVLTGRTIQGVDEEIWGWLNPNGEYEYVIHDIKQDIFLSIGPKNASPNPNSNETLDGVSVWSHDKNIYVRVKREDIATIYSVSGQLVKRVEVPEGDTAIPMQKGMYVVTLKDGSVHKVIIK